MTGTATNTLTNDALPLPGIDGSGPLGFLAALGILHALTRHSLTQGRGGTGITLAWQPVDGCWHPAIAGGGRNANELLGQLQSALVASDGAPWNLDKKLPFEAVRLREAAASAVSAATYVNREGVDVLASFGVESLRDAEGAFLDTSLRMVRAGDSAGQGLPAYATRIRKNTTGDDLRNALFHTWEFQDEDCALRWDPAEDRSYALRWRDPSKDRTLSVRAANRLAIEAMGVLPTVPVGHKVKTTGFGLPDGKTTSLTWPIWRSPARLDVVRSLLTQPELQKERPGALTLISRGVAAVYRCDRTRTSKYYSNFTPARRIA
jgi:hypothetical protein